MVPEGWMVKSLSSITTWSSGGTPPKNNPEFWNGHIPWISAASMRGYCFYTSKLRLTDLAVENGAKIAPRNSLLLLVRGSMLWNKIPVGIAKIDLSFNQDVKCIKLDSSQILSKFLLYWFLTYENRLMSMVTGTGIGAGKLETIDLKNLDVVLPPLPEQRKIAKILGTWDKAITTTEQLIATSKQQKKSLMQQLLTGKKRLLNPETGQPFAGDWKEVRLGDVCSVNPKKENRSENSLVSFVPMDAVSEDAKLVRAEIRHYSEVSKGFTAFIENDILVAKITPCFENGKGAKAVGLKNGVGFGSTEFHVLRAKTNIDSQFIYFLTNTSGFRIRGEMNMQGSAGQKRVTTDYLKLYKLHVPIELIEQQKIAQVLTAADNDIEALTAKLAHLKQEKKALMQQLLTGKRRVVVDEQEVA